MANSGIEGRFAIEGHETGIEITTAVYDAGAVPSLSSNGGDGNGGDANAGGTPTVPEPAIWSMMILGFGIVGVGMRRQSKRNGRPQC